MRKTISIVCIAVAVILAVVSWFLLPDLVVTQFGMDGQPSNYMSKAMAILIPLAVAGIGGAFGLTSDEKRAKKGIILSAIGILVMIVSLVINR